MKYLSHILAVVFVLSLTDSVCAQMILPAKNDSVFTVCDKMPEYPGGIEAMMNFVKSNLHYPDSARAHNVMGKVYVQFIVDETGNVSDPKVIKGIPGIYSKDFDNEALRIMKLMPKWNPGSSNGIPKKVYFNLPFNFYLK